MDVHSPKSIQASVDSRKTQTSCIGLPAAVKSLKTSVVDTVAELSDESVSKVLSRVGDLYREHRVTEVAGEVPLANLSLKTYMTPEHRIPDRKLSLTTDPRDYTGAKNANHANKHTAISISFEPTAKYL